MLELKRPDLKVITHEGESIPAPHVALPPKPRDVAIRDLKIMLATCQAVLEGGCNPERVAFMCEIYKRKIKGLTD